MNKRQEIIALLMQFLPAYPTVKMSTPKEQEDWKKRFAIYATVLQNESTEAINAAMLKLCRTCKFYPTVAEVLEQIESVTDYATDSRLPSPDEAWEEAMREAHDKFVYGKWELSTPEIEQAVKNFGKMALCELEPDGMNTARAQFMRIYSAICERKREAKTNQAVLDALPQSRLRAIVGGVANGIGGEGMTNGDRIRQMSDVEIFDNLLCSTNCDDCDFHRTCRHGIDECREIWLEWLGEEVGE